MDSFTKLIHDALDLQDQVREKLSHIIDRCHDSEGADGVLASVNAAASPLVAANSALEDILSAIEDIESD
jgi:hypothetical protein